jgi:hypothetical protein
MVLPKIGYIRYLFVSWPKCVLIDLLVTLGLVTFMIWSKSLWSIIIINRLTLFNREKCRICWIYRSHAMHVPSISKKHSGQGQATCDTEAKGMQYRNGKNPRNGKNTSDEEQTSWGRDEH